jgi:heptosyltransferase-1
VELLTAAAETLAEHGVPALVIWGPGERAEAERAVASTGDLAILAPATSLGVLAALLRRASLFVGGDSGPLHLACAVGCPVLGLYGPTDPTVNAPWGGAHEALYPRDRDYTGVKRIDRAAGGFEGLAPQAVRDAVGRLLALGK